MIAIKTCAYDDFNRVGNNPIYYTISFRNRVRGKATQKIIRVNVLLKLNR